MKCIEYTNLSNDGELFAVITQKISAILYHYENVISDVKVTDNSGTKLISLDDKAIKINEGLGVLNDGNSYHQLVIYDTDNMKKDTCYKFNVSEFIYRHIINMIQSFIYRRKVSYT